MRFVLPNCSRLAKGLSIPRISYRQDVVSVCVQSCAGIFVVYCLTWRFGVNVEVPGTIQQVRCCSDGLECRTSTMPVQLSRSSNTNYHKQLSCDHAKNLVCQHSRHISNSCGRCKWGALQLPAVNYIRSHDSCLLPAQPELGNPAETMYGKAWNNGTSSDPVLQRGR